MISKNKITFWKKIIFTTLFSVVVLSPFVFANTSYAETSCDDFKTKIDDDSYNFESSNKILSENINTPEDESLIMDVVFKCIQEEGNVFTSLLSTTSGAPATTYEAIANYQEIRGLTADSKVGNKTAFDLGFYSMKSLDVGKTSSSNTSTTINTNSLSNTSLDKIIENLGWGSSASSTTNYYASTLLYNDNGVKAPFFAFAFFLGKHFYLSGGQIQDTPPQRPLPKEDETTINPNDPCARYDKFAAKDNLVPSLDLGGNKFELVPQSPGTLNWKDLSLDEFLGGGRDDINTINRECIVGPGIWMAIIWKVILFFESLLGIIAVAMFLYGGYLYLTSGGDEGMVDKGIKSIIWSIVGIVVVLVSRLLVEILIPRGSDSVKYAKDDLLNPTTDNVLGGLEGIIGITNFILGFVAMITVIMIIYGGYLFVISSGDDSLEEKAKKIMSQSIIGLVIVIIAYTLVAAVFGAANIF
jgi:hypothetical protein